MTEKARERIRFIQDNPYMARAEIAKVLKMAPDYLTDFAKEHNLTIKSSKEILEELVTKNSNCSSKEIVKIVEEKAKRVYPSNYISNVAQKLNLVLPRSKIEKVVNVPVRKLKKQEEVEEPKPIVRQKPSRAPDYDKPRKVRCPAVYTQSTSPYGMAEKLGVTAKTKK